VPVLGIIENMAYFTPEELPENSIFFGKEGAKDLAEDLNVPFLGEIHLYNPFVRLRLWSSCSHANGIPIEHIFDEVTRNVVQEVVNRNESLPATEAVKLQQWQVVQR
jgi:ATP-binding protein involved in chromosome partitioning